MGTEQTSTSQIHSLSHAGITWLDVHSPDAQTLAELETTYKLHPVHIHETTQKIQHTQVERERNYIFFVMHYPIFAQRSEKIMIGQMGVFLGKDFLITIHTGAGPFLGDLFTECRQSESQCEKAFGANPAYLLYVLISRLLQSIVGMTDSVEEELDIIESLVFENTVSDAQRIGKARQKIIRLRRLIGPKRILLQDLAEQVGSFSGNSITKYYSNNIKMVNKLWEVIEEDKESIEIFKDADFTTSTENTNRTLAILTLLFTLTIPMTIIGALYGMNVFLPGGLEAGSWLFWGRYTTLILIILVSLLLGAGMFWYFRKKKWF